MQTAFNPSELLQILPVIVVATFAMASLLLDVFANEQQDRAYVGYLTLLGLATAFGLNLLQWGAEPVHVLFGTLAVDNYSVLVNAVLLATAALVTLTGMGYFSEHGLHRGEFYALMLMSLSGMMLMGMASDLLAFFIALELVSIPVYVLAAFNRHRNESVEAALKYFLMGAFSTAFLLFGLAFLYGAVGSTSYAAILDYIKTNGIVANPDGQPLMLMGMSFVIIGFAFKVAAAPFHMWTPDAYQGAPTPVTSFMAAAVKLAAFAGFIRLFLDVFAPFKDGGFGWFTIIWVLAVLTMTIGNLAALVQDNIKRMLAYSSIAHAGYLLVGFLTLSRSPAENGTASLLFYLTAYAAMNLAAFAIVVMAGRRGDEGQQISQNWSGFGLRAPALGVAMTIVMLSLAGMPPTAGFMGKFYIFKSAIDQGLVGIAIIAILNSLVSVYYYLRVIVFMYFIPPAEGQVQPAPLRSLPLGLAVLIAVAANLYLGILPSGMLDAAQKAVASLF
jgi:NADH-quinone oxidoreductase subunit N